GPSTRDVFAVARIPHPTVLQDQVPSALDALIGVRRRSRCRCDGPHRHAAVDPRIGRPAYRGMANRHRNRGCRLLSDEGPNDVGRSPTVELHVSAERRFDSNSGGAPTLDTYIDLSPLGHSDRAPMASM